MTVDIKRISDDDLQDTFTSEFEKEISSQNGFDSFECICKRDSESNVVMEVTIYGMAGSPTVDDYKNGKVKNAKKLVLKRDGQGELLFRLEPSKIISLNTNDYLVTYKYIG